MCVFQSTLVINIELRIDTIAMHRPTKFANALDVDNALRKHSKYPGPGGLVGAGAQMAISAAKTQLTSKENLMDTVIPLLVHVCSCVC
jgi:hypothetical protein